ncbi:MAG: hypothetical protein ABI873_19035 [Marmoricola sp.]
MTAPMSIRTMTTRSLFARKFDGTLDGETITLGGVQAPAGMMEVGGGSVQLHRTCGLDGIGEVRHNACPAPIDLPPHAGLADAGRAAHQEHIVNRREI